MTTRMHSSRMRISRALEVSGGGGCLLPGGLLPGGVGCLLPGSVSAAGGGGLPGEPPVNRILDTHNRKHYLGHNFDAAGKNIFGQTSVAY